MKKDVDQHLGRKFHQQRKIFKGTSRWQRNRSNRVRGKGRVHSASFNCDENILEEGGMNSTPQHVSLSFARHGSETIEFYLNKNLQTKRRRKRNRRFGTRCKNGETPSTRMAFCFLFFSLVGNDGFVDEPLFLCPLSTGEHSHLEWQSSRWSLGQSK